MAALSELGQQTHGSAGAQPAAVGGPGARWFAEVATGLWRTRGHLTDAAGRPLPGVEAANRHLRRTFELLAEAGVELVDPHGVEFTSGLDLDVVAFQPSSDLVGEVVIEVVRPSVYVGGLLAQRGEVIVGIPPVGGDGETS